MKEKSRTAYRSAEVGLPSIAMPAFLRHNTTKPNQPKSIIGSGIYRADGIPRNLTPVKETVREDEPSNARRYDMNNKLFLESELTQLPPFTAIVPSSRLLQPQSQAANIDDNNNNEIPTLSSFDSENRDDSDFR